MALEALCRHADEYPADLLHALADVVEVEQRRRTREVVLSELQEGMVLDEHVTDESGAVLVTRGQRIVAWLLERLRRHREPGRAVRQPIRVTETAHDDAPSHRRLELPAMPLTFASEAPLGRTESRHAAHEDC